MKKTLGYHYNEKEKSLIVNENEVPVVRAIFDLKVNYLLDSSEIMYLLNNKKMLDDIILSRFEKIHEMMYNCDDIFKNDLDTNLCESEFFHNINNIQKKLIDYMSLLEVKREQTYIDWYNFIKKDITDLMLLIDKYDEIESKYTNNQKFQEIFERDKKINYSFAGYLKKASLLSEKTNSNKTTNIISEKLYQELSERI